MRKTTKICCGKMLVIGMVLAFCVSTLGCASFWDGLARMGGYTGTASYAEYERAKSSTQPSEKKFITQTNAYEVNVMEKWGTKAKDAQGQVFQISSEYQQLILQRAAIIAYERGCKAFTILSTDQSSYSYDKYIKRETVTDKTTFRDSKGNVIGSAESAPMGRDVTQKVTVTTKYNTVQILKNEDDTRFNNIYSVSKYLPALYFAKNITITGLKSDRKTIIYLFICANSNDIINVNPAAAAFVTIDSTPSTKTFYLRGIKDLKDWSGVGEYYLVLSPENAKYAYYYTNDEALAKFDDIDKWPKFNFTNKNFGGTIDFSKFKRIDNIVKK